jgi:hypothetical protein
VGLLLFLDAESFSVHLWSLLPSMSIPSSLLISDAGPRTLGVVVEDPVTGLVLCYSSYTLPFDSSDPGFQNTREYMGFLFSILVLCVFRGSAVRGSSLSWKTDNTAALAWVQREMSSSTTAQTTLLAVTVLTLKLQLDIVSVIHIPGSTMGNVDSLSRGYKTSLDPSLYVNMQDSIELHTLFTWCDPTKKHSLESHVLMFERVHGVIDALLSNC